MNLNLYGHHGQWLMVDCGVSFDEPLIPAYRGGKEYSPRFDVVAPDPKFISQHKERLQALVVTHAHEDHVGAVAFYGHGYNVRFMRLPLPQPFCDASSLKWGWLVKCPSLKSIQLKHIKLACFLCPGWRLRIQSLNPTR